METLLLTLASLLAVRAPQPFQDAAGALEVGRTVFGSLESEERAGDGAGPAEWYELVPGAGGPLTLALHSYDFDAYLNVLDASGVSVAADDNGGVETDARLVLAAAAGKRFRVEVVSACGRTGEFWLEATPGVEPPLDGTGLLEAASAYRVTAAERALQKGDDLLAAWSRLREGGFRIRLAQYAQAREALESARELFAALGEDHLRITATFELGRAHFALGDYDAARECFEGALGEALRTRSEERELTALLNLGRIDEAQGRYDAARDGYERAVAIAGTLGDPALHARALGSLAELAIRTGDERAEELVGARMDLARELGDAAAEARALGSLGQLQLTRGERNVAHETFTRQLAVARRIGDPGLETAALRNLADVNHALSENYRAREQYEALLEDARASGDKAAEAGALLHLGLAWESLQNRRRALDLYVRALELYRELGDPVGEERAELNVATCATAIRDFARAAPILERRLEGARTAGETDRVVDLLVHLASMEVVRARNERARELLDEAHALDPELEDHNVSARWIRGRLLLRQGRYEGARQVFELGLADARERGDPTWTLQYLVGYADALHYTGAWDLASKAWGECLELARQLGKPEMEATALRRRGGMEWQVGRPERALELMLAAIRLSRDVGSRQDEMLATSDLGNVYLSLERGNEAVTAFRDAADLAVGIGDARGEALARGNLGETLTRSGNTAAGRPELQLALIRVRTARDRFREAWILGSLAECEAADGERAEARARADEALELWGTIDHPDPRMLRDLHRTLASVAAAEGDRAEARAQLARSDELGLRVRMLARAAGGSGTTNPALERSWSRTVQDIVALVAGELEGDALATWLAASWKRAGSAKANRLLAGIVEHRRGARSREAIRLRGAWRDAVAGREEVLQRMSEAIRVGEPARRIDGLREDADELALQVDRALRTFRTVSPRDAAVDLPRGVGPEELRAGVVDERTALVEYAEGGERLFAYVLTASSLEHVDLGPRAALETAVANYAALVGTPDGLGTLAEVALEGRALGERLLAPVLHAAGEGIERLVVVPTRPLAALSFEALVLAAPVEPESFAELEFAIDALEIVYGPSSPVLTDLATYGPRKSGGRILLLADPLYGDETGAAEKPPPSAGASSLLGGRGGERDASSFVRLPKTREEALAIADLLVGSEETEALAELQELRRKRSGSLSARWIDLHLGADASRARLEGSQAAYTILHLAAHGFIDATAARKSGIALSVQVDPNRQIDPNRHGDGQNGAFLTIADVLELDLDADLVVLSACDTARGSPTGDGLGSMARAFMYAGSRAVIASQWQVADWAAADTMKTFYEGALAPAVTPSQALRSAKLAIRHSTSTRGIGVGGGGAETAGTAESGHPFFWGPFVYVGLP